MKINDLRIKHLEKCFGKAIMEHRRYVGVKIWMFGFEETEVIINPTDNFHKKLEYYKNAYNEDLTLKNAPDKIKIVGFTYGDDFKEIQKDLLGL